MELDQILNLAEALLWFAIALILFLRAKRSVPNRMLMRISAAAFFVFGLSDLVEMVTRAWYQPIGAFSAQSGLCHDTDRMSDCLSSRPCFPKQIEPRACTRRPWALVT